MCWCFHPVRRHVPGGCLDCVGTLLDPRHRFARIVDLPSALRGGEGVRRWQRSR